MKKTFKSLMLLIGVFLIAGCTGVMGPSERVENMLNKYIKNDQDIIDELGIYIDKQDLTDKQKKRYESIVKDEYATIKYEIKEETIDGENATVEVEIIVKDLYKPSSEAEEYLLDNPTKFYTDGVYDPNKFVDYKLDQMEESTDTVTYTIYVNLAYKDDGWILEELDDATLEKIHGIYNYTITT